MKFWFIIPSILLLSCFGKRTEHKPVVNQQHLPIMGKFDLVEKTVDGQIVYDTVYRKIPTFSFTNQNGELTTEKNYENKVYLADFFFTTCPTICPKMTNTLYLVQEKLKGEKDFAILSHTIDPEFDSPTKLKAYAEKNKADESVWTFVTGDMDEIYDICENYYMSFAKTDSTAEGGYMHSGFLILVDKNKQVRGAYDGTMPENADQIAKDVKELLKEKSEN